MSSLLDHPTLSKQILPMTVETYHALGQMGLVEERTELIRGFVLPKMSKSPLHSLLIQRLLRLLRYLEANFCIRQEHPLTCRDSEPEPDFSVVSGKDEDYALTHPTRAELVIEVCVTTLDRDREKAEIYAEAGVPEYWLINPEAGNVEVYSEPSPQGYAKREVLGIEQQLTSVRFPDCTVAIRDLLS